MALIKVSELNGTNSVNVDDLLLVSSTSGSGYTSNHISIGDLVSSQPFLNLNGSSGTSGTSGMDGYTPQFGIDYFNGTNGIDGINGVDGINGIDGLNGIDGTSGTSGTSGESGTSGTSGTSGRDGIGGEVRSFSNSTTWNVNHNLDTSHPIVTVWDNSNKVIVPGQITSIDSNNLTVTFSVPTSGYVNVVKGGDVITGSTAIAGTSGSSGTSGLSNFGGAVGAFSSTQTQTTTGLTIELMTFDSIDISNNITSGTTTSEIKVLQSGRYNLQFSAQIQKLQGGTAENILIWFKKNGTDIPNSNTDVTLANNNHFVVASWNILLELNANDTVSVAWYSIDQHVQLTAVPNPSAGPTIPSVIITLTQV